jgi:hypothetical protein
MERFFTAENRPSPEEIKHARLAAKMTQLDAASLISESKLKTAYRTWQAYEAKEGTPAHNKIPVIVWEMFLLLTGQHPTMKLVSKKNKVSKIPKNKKMS